MSHELIDKKRPPVVPAQLRGTLERGTPNRLSPEATTRLKELSRRHTEEVTSLAITLTRENRSDVVSASDIEDASRALATGRHGSGRALTETVGGLFAGAGPSQFYVAATAQHPSALSFSLAAGSAIIGSAMIARALARGR